jgi:hypothetical protein
VARGPEEEEQAARVDLLVFLVDILSAGCGCCGGGVGVEKSWDYLNATGDEDGCMGLRHERNIGMDLGIGGIGNGALDGVYGILGMPDEAFGYLVVILSRATIAGLGAFTFLCLYLFSF